MWRDSRGYFAVCRGTGLSATQGHIIPQAAGGWRIFEDKSERVFMDECSAAAAVLNAELPAGIQYYELKRGDDAAIVATYPEMIGAFEKEGWAVISKSYALPNP